MGISKAKRSYPLLAMALGSLVVACSASEPYSDDMMEDGDPGAVDPGGKADGFGSWVDASSMRSWDDEENDAFSSWVAQLGEARADDKCSSLASCLRSPEANSLWLQEDAELSVYADCADLPYVLRGYFSYKRRLPFSFVSEIDGGRYSSNNSVEDHRDFTEYSSLTSMLRSIAENVHSGFYRIGPDVETGDHYPIQITRESVRPGTIYYDPNGHVLLVYAIEEDGTVRLMDGHPDNSLTVQRFGEKFARGMAAQGGGFRNWRHQSYSNGTVVRAANSESGLNPLFGTEQYAMSSSDYHNWVRARLSTDGKRDVAREYQEIIKDICSDVRDRGDSVARAIDDEVNRKAHPSSLPYNIYGTSGEWETYSTPSRDARLKAAFRELYRFVLESYSAIEWGNSDEFDFDGSAQELVSLYSTTWNSMASSSECSVTYSNSDGDLITLDLDQVIERLFDLSFDPYHCPELRWGAHPDKLASEYASCLDNADKIQWYRDEYRLRNRIDRDYDAQTTLDYGPTEHEEVDVRGLLDRL